VNRKILSIGLALLLTVTSLTVLSACGTKTTSTTQATTTKTTTQATTTQATTTKTTTQATTTKTTTQATTTQATTTQATSTNPNEPKYGGTLTVFTDWANSDPGGFDAALSSNPGGPTIFCNPYLEWMFLGDIDKYGPRGSNVFPFQSAEAVPDQYMVGYVAEKWELNANPMTLTWHVRHGLMFTGNTKIGMAPRELTADDVKAQELNFFNNPVVKGAFTFVNGVTVTDRYTVVVSMNRYDGNWPLFLGCAIGCEIQAPETVAAGAADWQNQTGTGPFILTDYVAGSQATYKRNPNYWNKTTINGKAYQMPFIDTLVYPIVPDESTRVADIRTAKFDWWPTCPITYADTLKSSSPTLIQNKFLSGNNVIVLKMNRLNNPYLTFKEVRQALFKATDFQRITDLLWPGADPIGFPVGRGNPGYVAISDLPAASKDLFTYDSAKAKQMIADAGFPNGFTVELCVTNSALQQDLASTLANQWAKAGVTVTIRSLDPTVQNGIYNAVSYPGMASWQVSTNNALVSEGQVSPNTPGPTYLDGPMNALLLQAETELDGNKRAAMETQLYLMIVDDAGMMGFANPLSLNCYWPWVKNYYNETECGYHSQLAMIMRIWIDPSLKK
jgi:peptide/nickel transport system substrate-binding protein